MNSSLTRVAFICLCPLFLLGQQQLASDSSYFRPDVSATPLSAVDNQGRTNLFFTTFGAVSHLKYDSNFDFLFQKNHSKSDFNHPQTRGSLIHNDGTTDLFFSNSNGDSFLILSIDREGNSWERKTQLDLKEEKFIDAFSTDNEFHVLTCTKKSSILNRYTYTDAAFIKTSYDLYTKGFCEKTNGICDLKNLFKKSEIQFIEKEVPATLGQTVKSTKIYPTKDRIIITSDHRLGTTVSFSLHLDSSDFDIRYYGNDYYDFRENARIKSRQFKGNCR